MEIKDNTESLCLDIYKKLTSRRFRAGSLPSEHAKELILKKIRLKVGLNEPIKLFQFWGGCKNSNLEKNNVGLCEEATLDNLYQLNLEVKKVYPKGLKIVISPGDKRVEFINLIPQNKTKVYVDSLKLLTKNEKYQNIFTVIPVSSLYEKYSDIFNEKLNLAKINLSSKIKSHESFSRLVKNAKKNLDKNLLQSDKTNNSPVESAMNYVLYRVAEEEALIFREFEDCIRSFFIKYIPFYKQYIEDIDNTLPNLDCSLTLFTGGKGNITQPWQAVGKLENTKVIFNS